MNQPPFYLLGMGTVRTKRPYHSLRHPRTFSERKANLDGWNRGKRSKRRVPDAWQDIPVDRDDRSWKNFRKTQYKIKMVS